MIFLVKHEENNYEDISVCLEHLLCLTYILVLFQGEKKSEVKMFFNFLVNIWTTVDENGSMTWTITDNKVSILYYFNDKNIDLEQILSLLNNFVETYGLNSTGWKLSFVMQVSNSEHWNYNYFKRVEFVVRRRFFRPFF